MKPREMSEKLKKQRFGVEIEMYDISRERAARVAADYFETYQTQYTISYDSYYATDRLGRIWKFSRDSSIIANTDAEKCELVTPILEYDDIDILIDLIRKLRKNGAKSDPNHMCGVHIHVDGEGHTGKTIRNLVKIVYSHEDQIAQGINLDEQRELGYCKKIDKNFLDAITKIKGKVSRTAVEDAWYRGSSRDRDAHYHESRYRMLNLHSLFHGHGTVEFRCFQFQNPDMANGRRNGLHAGQLKSMIQLALAINNAAKVSKSARCNKTGKTNNSDSFKGWLYRIGFVGKEFQTARQFLTRVTDRTEREASLAA